MALRLIAALLPLISLTTAVNCPLIGLEFPPPRDIQSHPLFQTLVANLTAVYDWLDADNNGTSGASNFSYSLQIFSTNPDSPEVLWERYHTAPNLPLLNSTGVEEVDGDTVYRIGSISKVYTVLAFLASGGLRFWNDPVTEHIPELGEYVAGKERASRDAIWETDWEDITLGALAAQLTGIARDYGILGEILDNLTPEAQRIFGFPVLTEEDTPPCGIWPLCNRTQFIEGITKLPVSAKPWRTPTYSNIAYQLLAYATENIAGKSFYAVLNETVLWPLNLTRTYFEFAPESVGIIPGSVKDAAWYGYLGDGNPTGNIFTSANDLSKLGRAILSSTLLKPSVTNQWLKPLAYTSDLYAGVGAPWGVRRIPLPVPPGQPASPHRTITAFNKAGSFRLYSSLLSLIPDWGIGLTVLLAGNISGSAVFGFADHIGASLLPTFDAIARDEAVKKFGGLYAVANQTEMPYTFLNITADPGKPGLGITPWRSLGVDMVEWALRLAAGPMVAFANPEVRIYYSGIEKLLPDGGKKIAFKAVFEDGGIGDRERELFSTNCASWLTLSGVSYGGVPLDEFVFTVDGEGEVVSVENLALQQVLLKIPQEEFVPGVGDSGAAKDEGGGKCSVGDEACDSDEEDEKDGGDGDESEADDEEGGEDDGGDNSIQGYERDLTLGQTFA